MARQVTNLVVRAYVDKYSRAELVVIRDAALAADTAGLPRVEVTGANFKDGGSSGVYVSGDPEYVISVAQKAIDQVDAAASAGESRSNTAMSHQDFSRRPIGW